MLVPAKQIFLQKFAISLLSNYESPSYLCKMEETFDNKLVLRNCCFSAGDILSNIVVISQP